MVNIADSHNNAARDMAGTIIVPDREAIGYPAADHGGVTPATRTGDRRPYASASTAPPGRRSATATRYLLAGIRIALGWIFLWAFLDKTFGLGHETAAAKSWLNGGSPTNGFLGSAAEGPFAGFYHSIAGTYLTDVLFMAALLGVGVALILGIGMRLAAGAGALLTIMMWTAVLPPASNPFMDDHLIYAAILIVLALLGAGNTLGLGRIWASLPLVRRAAWLQ
jgi:thiosulfate dehydrogenase [quinone] large subunit